MTIDPAIRHEFPILERTVHGMPITYLDSASTSLKPRCVLDAIRKYYEEATANVHRSTHPFGETVTLEYEEAREKVAQFLGARPNEIVFVRNTTEAINLVALGLRLEPGDEVLISPTEHHSNQLPWLSKVTVRYLPLDSEGFPENERLAEFITPRTRLLAVGLLSNVTGTCCDIAAWRRAAQQKKIPLLLDAAQAAGHMPIDVRELGCDFLAFSGHKLCGPSGIGVLWGKSELLAKMAPAFLGGGMVHESRLDRYTIKEPPHAFEAGTPNIEGAIGLAAALDFLGRIGMDNVRAHSLHLGRRLHDALKEISFLRVLAGGSVEHYGIATFLLDMDGFSAEAFGRAMADTFGIFLSSGMHCTHPYHGLLGYSSTVRASTHVYTTDEEVDRFISAIHKMIGSGARS